MDVLQFAAVSQSVSVLPSQKTASLRVTELNSISLLLEEQIQKLMLIESSQNYVFEYIEKPYAPEKKSKPVKSLIVMKTTE